MKLKQFSIFFLLSILMVIVSCQPHEGSESQLKEDVDSFATYYYNWHFEQASKYCTPESEVWLKWAASNVHPADIDLLHEKQEDAKIEIEDILYGNDETSATVSIHVSNFLMMDSIGKAAKLVDQTTLQLPMEIHEGKWKVKLEKLP